MLREEASEVPQRKSAIASHVPAQAFLDAVKSAREELIRSNDAVVAVEPAPRKGNVDRLAVYLDPTRRVGTEHRVPDQLFGFQTDVKPLPPAGTGDLCRSLVLNVDWRKIGAARKRAVSKEPRDTEMVKQGQVTVLADSSVWIKTQSGALEFRSDLAYAAFRKHEQDHFHFVCFVIAAGTWGNDAVNHAVGNYYVPVFNNVRGINHYKGSSFDDRSNWGTQCLVGCQVITMAQPSLRRRVFLHELGHAWCSYVTFDDAAGGNPKSPLLLSISDADATSDEQGLYHWARHFDDGSSCMDYDLVRWEEQPRGAFTARSVDDTCFEYCKLDRYLMGFLPRGKVGRLTILTGLDGEQTTYDGPVKRIGIDAVIKSCGERHADGPTSTAFRQAWVAVCADIDSGREFAAELDGFRAEIETAFHRATGAAGSLSTSLA
jgi:hypothetical protein